MRLFLKTVLGLVVTLALLLFVVVNFSQVTTALTCEGELTSSGLAKPETVYVELSKYRWWVRLWNSDVGNLRAESEKSLMVLYIPTVLSTGEGSLTSYMFWDGDPSGDKVRNFIGGYRTSNGEMTLKFFDRSVFVGKCKPR